MKPGPGIAQKGSFVAAQGVRAGVESPTLCRLSGAFPANDGPFPRPRTRDRTP